PRNRNVTCQLSGTTKRTPFWSLRGSAISSSTTSSSGHTARNSRAMRPVNQPRGTANWSLRPMWDAEGDRYVHLVSRLPLPRLACGLVAALLIAAIVATPAGAVLGSPPGAPTISIERPFPATGEVHGAVSLEAIASDAVTPTEQLTVEVTPSLGPAIP